MADEAVITAPGESPVSEVVPDEKKEHMVPLSALTGEREKYQNRETQYQSKIDELSAKLYQAEQQIEQKVKQTPASEQDHLRQQYRERLGIDTQEERLVKLEKRLEETVAKREEAIAELQRAEEARKEQSYLNVEAYVRSKLDPSLGITEKSWSGIVMSHMTDEEAWDLKNGRYHGLDALIARARKEGFKANGMVNRTKEAQHVRNLPKVPGPGGVPPGSAPEAKPFTSLRDLHKEAANDFLAIRERERS